MRGVHLEAALDPRADLSRQVGVGLVVQTTLAIWQNLSSSAGVIGLARFNAISVSTAALASSFVTIVAPRFIGKADKQP
jgi:hypothetical protein